MSLRFPFLTAAARVLRGRVSAAMGLGLGGLCVLIVAGCSGQPTRYAGAGNGRVFDPRLGVYASPKVVGDGEAIPRGGGGYLTGRPYVIGGRTYYPSERPEGYSVVGVASWYGDAFHGRRTANGEVFDKNSITAAHPTLPLPSYARVTNLKNGHSLIVRVNDRGPYHGGRVMDVSQRVAEALDFRSEGMARIKVEYVGRAGLGGSDDRKLLATLRVDGAPAQIDGAPPTEVAEAVPPSDPEVPVPPPEPARVAARVTPPSEMTILPDAETRSRFPRRPAPMPPLRPYDVTQATVVAGPRPEARARIDRPIDPTRLARSGASVPLAFAAGERGFAGAERSAPTPRRAVPPRAGDLADAETR